MNHCYLLWREVSLFLQLKLVTKKNRLLFRLDYFWSARHHISSKLTVAMAVIKLFFTLLNVYKAMGLEIIPSQLHRPKSIISFNVKLLIQLILLSQLFFTSVAFFLSDGTTVDEHGMSFYVSITTLSVIINILVMARKMANILTIFGKYEELIEKS